jgi:hypothetical protein
MTDQSDLPQDLADRADELLHTKPYADVIAGMMADSFEVSGLDRHTLVLVWLAALVAVDAPPASFLMNLGVASQSSLKLEQIYRVVEALTPIVGGPRVVSATVKIADVLSGRV